MKFFCRRITVSRITLVVFQFAALLAMATFATAASADDGLRRVDGPCDLTFPQDHGVHGDYRTEWWYYTGNLNGENGIPYGFQLTFFRTRLPGAAPAPAGPAHSDWRTPDIFLAHLAVTDIAARNHVFAENMGRGALGIAGVERDADAVTVRVQKWTARLAPARHHLTAATDDMGVDLLLTPEKPPVPHGDRGYSRKGDAPDQASCYYSLTRLAVHGTVRVGGTVTEATGLAWMDHEYSTAPLDKDLVGWDWFGLQLDDGTDVMLYRLRKKNGKSHPASSGTLVDASGNADGLSKTDFNIEAEDFWKSPETGGRYPVRWTVRIPGRGLTLTVASTVAAQEMRTAGSTRVNYWEGSVTITGTSGDRPVRGRGYVEMTGYAGVFDAPM